MAQYFKPLTEIYLCANTGIDEYNKPYFESNEEMASWLKGKAIEVKRECSFQRADDRQYCAINVDYNSALECDIILFKNAGHEPQRWIVGNITNVEFKNPNTTWVWFEVDAFCTYCGDIEWATSYSLVEREHVENDWNGANPNWDVMGVPEDITANPERKLTIQKHTYDNLKIVVRDPFKKADQNIINAILGNKAEPDFEGKMTDGMYEGLNSHVFSSAGEANEHFNSIAKDTDTDLNYIVDVQMVPQDILDGAAVTSSMQSPWVTLTLNNAKCFSSQFCLYAIEGMFGGTEFYKPELCESKPIVQFQAEAKWAAGTGGIAVHPLKYADQTDGTRINSFIINDFPKGTWVGNAFAQWQAIWGLNSAMKLISGGLSTVAGGYRIANADSAKNPDQAVLGGTQQVFNGIETITGTLASIQEARLHGTVLGGNTANSSPNLATALGEFGYYTTIYIGLEPVMKAIDSYFDRFGYKVMQLKIPNRNTRPFWNYVKTAEGHVSGKIPSAYRDKIESMLNSGVTFWKVPAREIGDFSSPEANKG